jgi:hypothetical protein
MNTEKPGGPFYQLSVDETLTSTNSTPMASAALKRRRACSSMVKMRYRKSG